MKREIARDEWGDPIPSIWKPSANNDAPPKSETPPPSVETILEQIDKTIPTQTQKLENEEGPIDAA